jgi:hypothetical protein
MANDISKRTGLGLKDPDHAETLPSTEITNSYLAYANSVTSSRIIGKLLKFTKFGEFLAGEEGTEVPMGTELIVHGDEMWVGWQKWEDNRPVDHVMGRMCDGFVPPRRIELDDTDESVWPTDDNNKPRDPWQNSAHTIMYDPQTEQIYTFATASKGGHSANGVIAKAYFTHSRMTPNMFPVIRLNWREYDHRDKTLGKIRVPIFEVIGWTSRAKIDEALQAAVGEATAQAEADQEAVDYYEEKPAPQQVQKPAPKQVPKLEREALPKSQQGQQGQQGQLREAAQRQPTTLSSAARKPRF